MISLEAGNAIFLTVPGFTHDIPHTKQSMQPLHHRSVTF